MGIISALKKFLKAKPKKNGVQASKSDEFNLLRAEYKVLQEQVNAFCSTSHTPTNGEQKLAKGKTRLPTGEVISTHAKESRGNV